jgi:hypothetical protein
MRRIESFACVAVSEEAVRRGSQRSRVQPNGKMSALRQFSSMLRLQWLQAYGGNCDDCSSAILPSRRCSSVMLLVA